MSAFASTLDATSAVTPSRRAFAITPSNSTDFLVDAGASVPKALYVGNTGDVAVQLVDDGATVTFAAVPGGSILPIRPRRVLATGTTASGIVGLL